MAIQMIPTTYDSKRKDIERQRLRSQLLRQQSQEPLPSGQMVSGHFVPTNPLHGLAQGIRAWGAGVGMRRADEREDELRQKQQSDITELTKALRGGNAPPEMIRSPDYQEPSLSDRLGQLEGNPYAANMMMSLALRQAEQEMEPKFQMLNDQQEQAMGLDPRGTWGVDASGKPVQLDKPEAPGMLTQNEQGEWVPNPAYMNAKKELAEAGRSNTSVDVNTGNTGPQFGTIPQGEMLIQNPDGSWQMKPIPGGPAAREQEKAEEQAKMKQAQKERYADVVTEDIDRAIEIVDTADIPVTGFGSYLSNIPGTPARDLKGLVDTIRANVGFDRLQQMRDASPTGGALGQVSELENRLLQATLGNLELSQSEEQFKRNLNRVKDIYRRIINEGIPEDEAQKQLQEVQSDLEDQPPEGVSADDWKYMTPEEKALFQ